MRRELYLALGLLALLWALLWALLALATTTRADGASGWILGAHEPAQSWWWREQANGVEAPVVTDPPGQGRILCAATADQAQVCVLVVRQPVHSARVGEQELLVDRRLWLPMVHR